MRPFHFIAAVSPLAAVLASVAFKKDSMSQSYLSNHHANSEEAHTLSKVTTGDDSERPIVQASTEESLTTSVTTDFLSKLPSSINITIWKGDFSASKVAEKGLYQEYDISMPRLADCKPRVSKFVSLGEGLECGDDNGCLFTEEVDVKRLYEVIGMSSANATLIGGEGEISLRAEVSYEWNPYFNPEIPLDPQNPGFAWEQNWPTASSKYTFELQSGDYCVPGMVNIDLECEISKPVYWWATRWSSSHKRMSLEYSRNRHEAAQPYSEQLYKGGYQYCTPDAVNAEFWWSENYQSDMWKPIVKEDGYRGWAYVGNSMDLERFRIKHFSKAGTFREGEMLVHRYWQGDRGNKNVIFRCVAARTAVEKDNMEVPLSDEGGGIVGYVGCVKVNHKGHAEVPGFPGNGDGDGELKM